MNHKQIVCERHNLNVKERNSSHFTLEIKATVFNFEIMSIPFFNRPE